MSAPSEPEKYSVDEMLERLKNRPAEEVIEDGELVIRADGSQAIKVRKRKRRTQQPHKDERKHRRRVRVIQVAVAFAVVLTAVVGAGTAIVFANSAPFREQLLQKISQSSGARAVVEQFRMNPTSANAEQVSLAWPDGNALRSLTLRRIRATISPASFLGQSLTGEEVTCGGATLILQFPQADKPVRDTPAPGANLPVRFESYTTTKAEMILGDPAAPLIRMQNSECSFYPVGPNERAQLLLNRGDVTISGWPKLRMDRSHIEFRGTEMDVVVMRLLHETDNRGVFELAGTIFPYAAQRASILAIRLEAYPLSGIAGPELGRLIAGRIDTVSNSKSNLLSFIPGANPDASLAIAFRNSLTSSFELNGFQFLLGFSQTLKDPWFERPVFESDVSGVIRRAHGNIAISDLNLENKGRLAIRGSLIMNADRSLSGSLEAGLAEAMIKSSKSVPLDALFGPPKDGFRWLTLKIGGTATAPTDNFRELFGNASQAKKREPTGAVPTFEELTIPQSDAPPGSQPTSPDR